MRKTKTGITIRIPMERHLHRYVLYTERLSEDDTLDITRPGIVCDTISLLLSRKREFLQDTSPPPSEKYAARLPVWLNSTRWNRNEIYVTNSGVRKFNRHIHQLFHHELAISIRNGILHGIEERDVIEAFLNERSIGEDDVRPETVKRSASKYRKSRGELNLRALKNLRLHGENSPFFHLRRNALL